MKILEKKSIRQRPEIRAFLEKIVIDAGVGRLSQQANFEDKILPQIMTDIGLITGQRPQVRKAKKSIAGFKVREGQIVGLKVTLRREKMVDFFERLITIVLPRIRDFIGLDEKNVDAGGILNIGIKEQGVFPEISLEQSPTTFSIGISIVPKKKNRQVAIEEFKKLGVPLKVSKAKTKNKRV
jgi:large subunit ribosomal protein L5